MKSVTGSLTELHSAQAAGATDIDQKLSAAESGENYGSVLAVSLGDLRSGSGTEGSSFGSNSSSHALLTPPALTTTVKIDDPLDGEGAEKLMEEPLNTDL